jgi:phospholipid transport system substrate-binding protein
VRRRNLLAFTLLAPLAARAQAPALADAVVPEAAAPIVALNDGLLAVMHAGRDVAFKRRVHILQPIVERSFDLLLILQNSVGPRWGAMPGHLRSQLSEIFNQFTVASWVANFDTYDGERFQILPELRQVGGDEVVQTRLVPTSGEAIRLDYVMRRGDDGWRVIDVLLDGSISRVAVQRSDFRAMLRGGDPTPLIASLREKVAALSTGTGS